jgi:two-component system sensor histidine kinase UhpB
VSTSIQPGPPPENRAIEAQSDGWRRPAAVWLALYPFAWLALAAGANIFWYPPAGLRLGTLWLLPRRAWWAMAALDIAARLALALYDHAYASPWGLAAGAAMPWCLYALALRSLGRHGRGTPPRRALPRLLGAGFAAAVLNSIVLTGIDLNDDGGLRFGLPAMLVTYALGDFAGIVLVTPLMLALHGQAGERRLPWRKLLANGLVFAPAGVLLALKLLPRIEAPVYPLALALLPLFLVVYRHGWRQAAVAFALLGACLHLVPLPLTATLLPGQLPLLMAIVGCAVLLLGVSVDRERERRRELDATVQALSAHGAELARAANRMAALQEQERRRIGAGLHDQLGQDMTAIATRLRIVELTATNPAVLQGLASISNLLADAHQHLREVINELHPAVLDRFGLARAIAEGPFAEMLRDRDVLYTSMIQGKVDRLPDSIASAIYRICQEAATNCARHGCGGRMHIRLRLLPAMLNAELVLEIEDQAGAIRVNPERPGHGLLNIRDRAHAIGADYTFDPESGTPRHRLNLWLPLPEET